MKLHYTVSYIELFTLFQLFLPEFFAGTKKKKAKKEKTTKVRSKIQSFFDSINN